MNPSSANRRPSVGLVGASGFVGSASRLALEDACIVRDIAPPRFRTSSTSAESLSHDLDDVLVGRFAERLEGLTVLVNSAGLASATSTDTTELHGANALLPAFLASAAARAGVKRFVHVSSAAVQGRMALDQSERLRPESPYAHSKALAEEVLREVTGIEVIRYRPTSVHGPTRTVTRQLLRLAESPLAAAAAPGDDHSPQIPVARVAEAVRLLVDLKQAPPAVVLHPWEGVTTRSVLADLGGREPRMIPRRLARRTVALAYVAARSHEGGAAHARRLEIMLFGQPQTGSWLDGRLTPHTSGWLMQCRKDVLAASGAGR